MAFVYLLRRSPFVVEVGLEAGFQKVRAWGPGLKTGMVGKSADFVVEAIGTEVGTLGESPRPPPTTAHQNTMKVEREFGEA